jgi:gas vesicle protein
MSEKTNSLSILILGAVAGAAITYLLTNKKGQELSGQLIKEAKKILSELEENLEESEENLVSEGQDVGEKVTEKIEQVKSSLEEISETIPEHIDHIQKKGRRFFFKRPDHSKES